MKLIDLIASKNAQDFKAAFEERMAEKVVSAIEQEKILVAQSFFDIEESVNEEFDLHAERSDTFAKKFIKTFKSKDAAAAHVEKMEDNEKWPEGHEAVLTHKKTGEKHIYIDDWEKLGEEVEQIDELDQKTLRSYVRKKSKVDPDNINVAKATKKLAAKQPTSSLQKKLRTLRYKSPQDHKNPFEYDAVRDELKNRGMNYFGGGRRR